MPTYTFYCLRCKYKFSGVFSMNQSDGKNVVCPKCKSKKLKRVWEGEFFIKKNSAKRNSCSTCSSGVCSLDS